MHVILSVLHFANLRNFESVVCGLAERGHRVHVLAEEPETLGGQALAERLAAAYPTVTWGFAPTLDNEAWSLLARKVRQGLDYVRFLADRYADVPKLRLRNAERAPRLVRWLTTGAGGLVVGHARTARLLQWVERRLPLGTALQRLLEEQRPDALLLTALTFSRSSQIDQLKVARALGLRTMACILSWDHLSSKAPLHIAPDVTLVWNDVQKHEAIDMHGLPADRVIVTGAQCYDQWFERRPSRSRETFCADLGLEPARRIVLYVCSTMSPVPDPVEPVFVKRWAEALRASAHHELRDASIVVRPHPERLREWRGVDLSGIEGLVLHGRSPIDPDAKADYFDSLYYSDAVVGLCTSAFLEAAIIGRPVLTMLLPEYRLHQDGMVHFRYLQTIGGGLLHSAHDLPTHFEQLVVAVRSHGARDARNQAFLTSFVRPAGLDEPATPRFVEAVEQLAASPSPQPDAYFAQSSLARRCVTRIAVSAHSQAGAWLLEDSFDRAHERVEQESVDRKHDIVARRDADRQAKATRRDEALRAKARQRRAKAWTEWRRRVAPGKRLARLTRSVRHLIGPRP